MGLIYGRNQKWPSTFPSISLPYDLGFVIFQWEWVKKSSPRGPQILGYMFSINHMCCSPTVFLGRYLRFTMTIEGILTNIFGIITIHSMNPFEPCKFHTWHAQLCSLRNPFFCTSKVAAAFHCIKGPTSFVFLSRAMMWRLVSACGSYPLKNRAVLLSVSPICLI